MSKEIDSAIKWALSIADDNKHGYDQDKRWGNDYDCSSLIISAYEQAGVPVKSNGASYTGDMKKVFLKNGFIEVVNKINLATGSGLIKGDVLLKEGSHVVMYIGNGQIVHASLNENNKTTGGKVGDQTGKEICRRSYYNKQWNSILRYTGGSIPLQSFSKGYIVGNDYTVQVDGLNIREGAGTNYSIKGKSLLTKSGQAQSNSKGQYNKGIKVTVQEVKKVGNDTWVRTPSGWLCAIYNSKTYIS